MLLRASCPPISVTSLIGGLANFLPLARWKWARRRQGVSQPVFCKYSPAFGAWRSPRAQAAFGGNSELMGRDLVGCPPLASGCGASFLRAACPGCRWDTELFCLHARAVSGSFAALNTLGPSQPFHPGIRKREARIGAASTTAALNRTSPVDLVLRYCRQHPSSPQTCLPNRHRALLPASSHSTMHFSHPVKCEHLGFVRDWFGTGVDNPQLRRTPSLARTGNTLRPSSLPSSTSDPSPGSAWSTSSSWAKTLQAPSSASNGRPLRASCLSPTPSSFVSCRQWTTGSVPPSGIMALPARSPRMLASVRRTARSASSPPSVSSSPCSTSRRPRRPRLPAPRSSRPRQRPNASPSGPRHVTWRC